MLLETQVTYLLRAVCNEEVVMIKNEFKNRIKTTNFLGRLRSV
jgi:hypothetical protein